MNKLINTQIILLLLFTLISCGKKQGDTSGRISIISGFSAISTQYSGGVALFARNLDSGVVKSKKLTSNDEIIEFSNGRYDFLIMAWDGPSEMTGSAHCANKDNIKLDGEDISLDFLLKEENCNTLSSLGNSLSLYSNIMRENIPAFDGVYSVKLILYEFDGVPTLNPNGPPRNILGTNCLIKSSSATSFLELETAASSFAAIDLPVVAEVYDGKDDCSGKLTRRYLLPNGLDKNSTTGIINAKSLPLKDLVFSISIAASEPFSLPLAASFTYDLNIDWGDDSTSVVDSHNDTDATHTYNAAGNYIIRVNGIAESLDCDGNTSCGLITHILNFGDLRYTSLKNAFKDSMNLKSFSGGVTDNVSNMSQMFFGASSLATTDFSSFNTSSVTDMSGMFKGALIFNGNISSWNTSNVLTMENMFSSADLFNQDISRWNTSRVTDMSLMFSDTDEFNQNLSSWDTSNVTTMEYMFSYASKFNQDISSWNTSNVQNMDFMFQEASVFNQDLSGWCVTNINTNPDNFDLQANLWNTPSRPVWGTCPQ